MVVVGHGMRTGAHLADWALKAAGFSCSTTTAGSWFQSLTVLTVVQHYWTVRGIRAATVNKLHRLQESIRQRAQTITVEYCQTVRNPLTLCWHFQELISEFQLLCENRHWSHWILRHHYWCPPKMYTVTFSVRSHNRLCHAAGHKWHEPRHKVDKSATINWSRLCWWHKSVSRNKWYFARLQTWKRKQGKLDFESVPTKQK